MSPDGNFIYVANEHSNSVSVINTASNTITATIPVGSDPLGVSVSPNGDMVYVTDFGDNSVSVINTASNTVTATITVGSEPLGVSVTPDGKKVYIANNGGNSADVINTATNTVTAACATGNSPYAFGNFISTYGDGIAPQSMVAAGIDIYPNPASEEIRVIGNQSTVSGVEVFNLLGEKIYNLPITDNRSPITINVVDFPAGVYIVKVKTEKGMEVKKFIKE